MCCDSEWEKSVRGETNPPAQNEAHGTDVLRVANEKATKAKKKFQHEEDDPKADLGASQQDASPEEAGAVMRSTDFQRQK